MSKLDALRSKQQNLRFAEALLILLVGETGQLSNSISQSILKFNELFFHLLSVFNLSGIPEYPPSKKLVYLYNNDTWS